mgnify:CR=1 FL=1
MKYLIIFLCFPYACFANAERCEEISEVAFGQALMRGSVFEMISSEKPDPPMNEMWRWLALQSAERYENLGVPKEEQQEIAKDISDAKFTKNYEADSFLIKEYYYVKCITPSNKLRFNTLRKVKAKKMAACWHERKSNGGTKNCVLKLVAKA